MTIQDTTEIREKIISVFKNKGPCLPINIAKETGLNTLFASAFLSEFIAEKKIKVSYMKVGSSPLYFIPGQENMLEKFSEYLKGKEKEAFMLLKENNFLKDSQQQPAIRVALRSIKDFAIPFKKNEEFYWKYFTADEKNLEARKEEINKIEIEKIKPEILTEKKEEKIIQKGKKKIIKKKVKSQKNDKFFDKIKNFLSKKSINIVNIESISKNEMALKVENNGKEQLLIAYNKKRIVEKDLIKASKKALELKMKYTLLSFGETSKKLKEFLQAAKSLLEIEKVED